MIVYERGPDAVRSMIRVEPAAATEEPPSPIGYFDFHGCVCGVATVIGGGGPVG